MFTFGRNLVAAWSEPFEALGISPGSRVLLVGPDVEALALEIGAPVADSTVDLVTVGDGAPEVPMGATAAATRLEAGCVDAAVYLSPWAGMAELAAMTREALRVARPGGVVVLGELDASALSASAATFRSALLYRRHPEIAARVAAATLPSSAIGVEAVRAGLSEVKLEQLLVPMMVVPDADSYIEAVRSGLWPGTSALSAAQLDALLDDLRDALREPVRFPVVDHQPWWVARGVRTR